MTVAAVVPNWVGDLVMVAPALRALARALGGEGLDLVAHRPLAPLARALYEVRDVVPHRKERGVARLRLRTPLMTQLRRGAYRSVVLFANSFSTALSAWRAGIPRRVGMTMHGRSLLLTTRVAPRGTAEHQADAYVRIVEAALGARPPSSLDDGVLAARPEAIARAEAVLAAAGLDPRVDRFVVLTPGAAYGPAKQWGAAQYAALARLLAREGFRPVVDGTVSDRAEARSIAEGAPEAGVVDLTGRIALAELPGLLSLAAGFVGNDSGATHLAAALGTPTVAVFVSTDPTHSAQRGPRVAILSAAIACGPCGRRRCPRGDYACRRAVAAERVVRALSALVAGPDAPLA
jgi:heptosyltransferase-2